MFPMNLEEDLIKRVIGLPGESVTVQDGVVRLMAYPSNEPYINAAPFYNGEWQVPEGQLFVLGDNRNDSQRFSSVGIVTN